MFLGISEYSKMYAQVLAPPEYWGSDPFIFLNCMSKLDVMDVNQKHITAKIFAKIEFGTEISMYSFLWHTNWI